jgi:hypothetical protein
MEEQATPTQLATTPTFSPQATTTNPLPSSSAAANLQTTPTSAQATPITPGSTSQRSPQWNSSQNNIVIKRGRGAAKTLNLDKLQMPLNQG